MLRFLPGLVLTLAVLGAAGPSLGADESDLAQGREALARRDYPAAVDHLKSAVRALDPARDAAELGDAWLQLGIAYLNGLGQPEEALPAFLASAATSPEPSTAWLWASVAAERLGRVDEAAAYRTRAIPPPAPKPAPAAPAPAPVPAPAPAPVVQEPAPQPQPEPVKPVAAAPNEKPDAVQHFFGEEAVQKEEKPVAEAEPQEPAKVEAKEKKKVDAFEHFFGEKKEATEEKPPV